MRLRTRRLLVLVVWLLGAWACGVKGPPRPPASSPPEQAPKGESRETVDGGVPTD